MQKLCSLKGGFAAISDIRANSAALYRERSACVLHCTHLGLSSPQVRSLRSAVRLA